MTHEASSRGAGLPPVSVVVPVLDGAATIGALLDAVDAQVTSFPFEVIVADNGSTDGTRGIVSRHPVRARLVEEPREGSYAARNTGVHHSHGSILAFVDADCVPAPGWLEHGVAAVDAGADLVAGRIEPRLGPSPTVWARYDAAVYLDQRAQVEQEGFGATANLFVRRAAFEAVGGFDASLGSGGDQDLCLRATGAGFVITYEPDAVVGHEPRATLADTWKLHRRLGGGWAHLAQRGLRGPWWRDPALRTRPGWVAWRSRQQGHPLRVRQLLHVHAVAMAARWWGRLRER